MPVIVEFVKVIVFTVHERKVRASPRGASIGVSLTESNIKQTTAIRAGSSWGL